MNCGEWIPWDLDIEYAWDRAEAKREQRTRRKDQCSLSASRPPAGQVHSQPADEPMIEVPIGDGLYAMAVGDKVRVRGEDGSEVWLDEVAFNAVQAVRAQVATDRLTDSGAFAV